VIQQAVCCVCGIVSSFQDTRDISLTGLWGHFVLQMHFVGFYTCWNGEKYYQKNDFGSIIFAVVFLPWKMLHHQ
jgi:hypothetical protein